MHNKEPVVFIIGVEDTVRNNLSLLLKSLSLNVKTFIKAREFLDVYDPSCPGCLVSEVQLPEVSGLELQETLLARRIEIPLIFLSNQGDVFSAVRAMKMGALDYFEKPFNSQLLVERIQQGTRQDIQNRQEKIENEKLLRRYNSLTEREKQIMDLIVIGQANKVIAHSLGLSQKTVEFHRSHVMEKMKAESVAQLVRIDVFLALARENPKSAAGKFSFRPFTYQSNE